MRVFVRSFPFLIFWTFICLCGVWVLRFGGGVGWGGGVKVLYISCVRGGGGRLFPCGHGV